MTEANPLGIKVDAKVCADFDPLIKATPKGISRLFSLIFGRRETDNLRHKMLTAAKTQKEYQQILSGEYTLDGDRLVPVQCFPTVECLNPLQIEEKQEIKNLAGNIHMAVEALKDIPDKQIPDQEIDEDFFARWRRDAKVIGHEDLQRLWGRLLAEEIKSPGNISYRALDTMKNITSNEAQLFQKIVPFIESGKIFVCDMVMSKLPPDISFNDILALKDCGLLTNTEAWTVRYSYSRVLANEECHYCADFYNMKIVALDVDIKITIPGIPLSSAGVVAYTICDNQLITIDQTKYLCDIISSYFCSKTKKLGAYRLKSSDVSNQDAGYEGFYEFPEANE